MVTDALIGFANVSAYANISSEFDSHYESMAQAQHNLTILFADIAGSTELYERVGDVEAHRRVAESLSFMASAVIDHTGKVLRTVGDSTLASFDSCDSALLAASAMHVLHKSTPLSVRVGFHYGPVIEDKGDVYGNAVNIAARVASFAKTEEITATEDCINRLSVDNRARATLLDRVSVKGVSAPVGVYRLTWEADEAMHTRVATPALMQSSNEFAAMDVLLGREHFQINKTSNLVSIGRGDDCNMIVNGDRVSRHHARLSWSAGQIQLTDTSTNGTYVHRHGEQPVFLRRETLVLEGDGRIGFGDLPTEHDPHSASFKSLSL